MRRWLRGRVVARGVTGRGRQRRFRADRLAARVDRDALERRLVRRGLPSRRAASLLGVVAAAALPSLTSCARSERPPGDGASSPAIAPSTATAEPDAELLKPLRELEAARRASTDFARLPSSGQAFGPDPYAIRALPGTTPGYVAVLRGRDALVQLDAKLAEVERLPAPASPGALDVGPDGDVWVAGELATAVARYHLVRGALQPAGELETGVASIRAIAVGPERVLHVSDDRRGSLTTIALGGDRREVLEACPRGSAVRLARTRRHLIVDCLLDHALVSYRVDDAGFPRADTEARATQDAPLFGFDAVEAGDDLVIAAGGVEDHPLDRTSGFFGFIDSYVFLYRQAHGDGPLARVASVNVSEAGVVTPKAILLSKDGAEAVVTGYGGDRMATVRGGAVVETRPMVPGISSLARGKGGDGFVAADPLVDAFVRIDADGFSAVDVADTAARSDDSKLGEALLFTTLMAPWNRSDGALSRFTCETCHFEQYVDGRTHHTGREDIHATTKPLVGLFNNRPHFSRALDPDLTTVARNEFRVAGAHSGAEAWFSITTDEFPWVEALHLGAARFSPVDLRRAFMTYLMESAPRPNPAVVTHVPAGKLTDTERAGAAAFRDHCAGCHAARLVDDDAATEVPFDGWEAMITSPAGPIVWASPEYRKTGVEPYVNELGCRTPSLRRLYKKRPYFTNGSAPDLAAVLERARETTDADGRRFLHDGGAEDATLAPLDPETRRALLAFLDLL